MKNGLIFPKIYKNVLKILYYWIVAFTLMVFYFFYKEIYYVGTFLLHRTWFVPFEFLGLIILVFVSFGLVCKEFMVIRGIKKNENP